MLFKKISHIYPWLKTSPCECHTIQKIVCPDFIAYYLGFPLCYVLKVLETNTCVDVCVLPY